MLKSEKAKKAVKELKEKMRENGFHETMTSGWPNHLAFRKFTTENYRLNANFEKVQDFRQIMIPEKNANVFIVEGIFDNNSGIWVTHDYKDERYLTEEEKEIYENFCKAYLEGGAK